MYDVSVPMALVDFIPVAFFAVAAVLLQKDLYHHMPKYSFACFAAGTIDIMLAGFLKALWKLLYALGVCDFQALNTMFLPVQSVGFLLAGLGLILMLTKKRSGSAALAVAPPVFRGTFVFISMMVLGLGAICACLSIVAARLKKHGLIVLFVLSFVCSMGMGYLSGRDSTAASVNWIEQGVNCVGQGLFLLGTLGLHRADLRHKRLSRAH